MGRHIKFSNEKVNFKPGISKMFKSLKKYYVSILVSLFCTAMSVVLAIFAPQILSKLSDIIFDGASTNSIDLNEVSKIAITLVVFYVSNALLQYIAEVIMNTVTQKYARDLRKNISDKINKLELKYFDSRAHGETLSIVTNDVDTLGSSLQQSVTMICESVLTLTGVLIAMFITSWQMALTVLASLPLIFLMLLIITKFAVPLFKKRQEEIAEINGVVEENYSGLLVTKAFNAEEEKSTQFEKVNKRLNKTMFKAQFFGGLMQPMMSFISYFAYSTVCLVGGLLMSNGNIITFGTITAFLVYVNLFQSPLSQIAQAMNNLQMAAASSNRIFNFLAEPELKDDSNKPNRLLVENNSIKGSVEFKNVSFGYDKDKLIIPDFSAKIEPGMKVAIVGPTGAGKTTLVNLLMGFYDINSGDILIDGVSIKDMKKSEIRDIFGMVLQDSWLFEGTLRENIIFNKPNITEEKLSEIIEDANLTHFIATLENGIDTEIKDDESISAGQKQLITIARALVQDSPLLILDEATSNVDTRTEILIQEAMDRLTQNRTSFVIAHRLSTIKNADLILVMKEGNIVEQGTHEQLLLQNGFYAEIYNSQFTKKSS